VFSLIGSGVDLYISHPKIEGTFTEKAKENTTNKSSAEAKEN
jgi:hypothetical protein